MYTAFMAHNPGYLSPHPDIVQGHIAAGPANSEDIAIPMHASHAMITIIEPIYMLHFLLGIHNPDITGCRPKRKEKRFGFASPIYTVDRPVRERGTPQVNYCPRFKVLKIHVIFESNSDAVSM
jgi:hypothetical protein